MATTKKAAPAAKAAASKPEVLCPDCAGFGHFKAGGKSTVCGRCHGSGMVVKPTRAPRATRSSSSVAGRKRTRKAAAKTAKKVSASKGEA